MHRGRHVRDHWCCKFAEDHLSKNKHIATAKTWYCPAADQTSSFRWSRAPAARAVRVNLSSDDKIDGFWTFALLVRFNVETDPLPLVQALQSGLFYCGNMNKHVASAVIWLDETVAPLAIEEFHDTRLRHREYSFPHCSAAGPTHDGSAGHSQSGKASAANGLSQLRRPPQEAERHCQYENYTPTTRPWKGAMKLLEGGWLFTDQPIEPKRASASAENAGEHR